MIEALSPTRHHQKKKPANAEGRNDDFQLLAASTPSRSKSDFHQPFGIVDITRSPKMATSSMEPRNIAG